ncbi:LysE family translocator [Marinicella sp. S1101]|uniref:LysE family translocator n=1 Tax=Marinicella marina TaxID=2996016 RepID=UPI00226102A2|nr:LysE family translocator [Marinicella marina]MCX7553705.1 LysE family translocator [Marinicella marina]MDJ1140795.1 LysE family translocator [Marinicella marina]
MSLYLSFAFTAVILALTPGPDVLLVVAIAAKEGFNKALQLTLGLASGVVVHTTLILLGFSAFISASPMAMNVIALFGAVYLLYLAWLTWVHRNEKIGTAPADQVKKLQGSYYLRGVIMNISNPKVLLFFLALFPQFAQLDEPGYQLRIIILGLIFIFVTIFVFGGLAYMTAKFTAGFMQNNTFKQVMDLLTVLLFVLLAGLLMYTVIE